MNCIISAKRSACVTGSPESLPDELAAAADYGCASSRGALGGDSSVAAAIALAADARFAWSSAAIVVCKQTDQMKDESNK